MRAQVLLLTGGRDYWSNGIHLAEIEAADSAADESWRNINAIDDLARAIIETTDRLVVSVVRGNVRRAVSRPAISLGSNEIPCGLSRQQSDQIDEARIGLR
ncbi:hypothetical protein ACVWW4_004069 [Bradyrhizobium sp. LB7.1]